MEEMAKIGTAGESIVASGAVLQRTQTQFTQAIAIQKPRKRLDIVKACEEEAAIAGDEFYYSWTVKDNRSGKTSLVEGLSVQAALAAARNWGNCAIPCQVDETPDAYIFTATFLDMETGFNLQRTFRQRKNPNIGKYDRDRAEDITFQIGQSKAIRNVVLNALPSWLTTKMMTKAKENVVAKIQKMGIPVAKEKTLKFLERYGITAKRVEKKLNKKAAAWDAEDLALLQGAMNSLSNGQETPESLFPTDEPEKAPATKADTVQPAADPETKPEAEAKAPEQEAPKSEPPKEQQKKTPPAAKTGSANAGKVPDGCTLDPNTCDHSTSVDEKAVCTATNNRGECQPWKGKKY